MKRVSSNTINLCDVDSKLAWGCYQQSLLNGTARWSGADLRGKAREHGRDYSESRRNLLSRIHAKYNAKMMVAQHGRLVLLIESKKKEVSK